MPRTQKVVQYIQRVAYETFVQRDEGDERPEDAQLRALSPAPNNAAWSATSFAGYVPFRGPTYS